MSDNFLSEIADQLRNQTPLVDSNVDQTAVAEPKTEETKLETAVNDQITDSVTTPNEIKPKSEETETISKQWWEDEEVVVDAKPTAETKTIEPQEEKTQFELDEDLKLLLEYKKSGKTLKDFVNEYKIDDISSWSDEQIVKNGIVEFMGLQGEELEQAIYDFENASIFQKKQWAESFKQQYAQKNQDKLKELTSSNEKTAEYEKVIAEKYNAELETFSQKVVGQELYGMKITDEMSKDLKNFIDKEFTLQRTDGSFDVEKMYSIGLWLKYGKDMMKANITKARNEGKEQVLKEVTNPSKNMTGGGRVVGSGVEAAQEAFNTLFPG
jgi:hypothetical protein